MIRFVSLDQDSTYSPLGPRSRWDCFKPVYDNSQFLWLFPQQFCYIIYSFLKSRQNFDYSVITCFVLNTYRTRSSSTSNLKIVSWSRLKLSFVRDFCSCSESCILVFSRIKPYSTAALKLITTHLDSSLDTHHLCFGSLVEEGTDGIYYAIAFSYYGLRHCLLRYFIHLKCHIIPASIYKANN